MAILKIIAEITQQIIEIVKLKNPSGICIGLGEYSIQVSSSNELFDKSGRYQKKSYDYQYANIRWLIPICGKDFQAGHVLSQPHHHTFGKQRDGDH